MVVRRLIYVSCPDPRMPPDGIARIASQARANNAGFGISGILLYTGRDFAQLIEGAPSAIESLWRRIQRDPRHGDIVLVHDAIAEERWFGDWRMGYVYDPRIAEAISRWRTRTVPFQGAELDELRELLARADAM